MADAINAGDASDRILVEWDLLNEKDSAPSANQIFVEIPKDIVEIRRTDIESARNWRKIVREALKPKLDAGWSIVDFTKDHKYVLSEEK
jgi:predicted GNAT superfamily acetyltransferase